MALRMLLGIEPTFVSVSVAVLFTYALHALVWCTAALVALSRTTIAPAMRHRLWKLALLGPCLTAPIAALAPAGFGRLVARQVVSLTDSHLTVGGLSAPAQTHHTWSAWLALGFAVAAGLGVLRFAFALVQLQRRLRSRTPVRDPRVLQRFEQLRARANWPTVRLTESIAIDSPLVVGVRELCLPRVMLEALGDAELDAVLAHELAHLERRDGVWFPIAGFLQALLWMQPLNHWIARHFRQTAELACDDRAIELTGDRMGLARALVQVAERALSAEQSVLIPSMAGTASVLHSRVQRLATATQPALRAARSRERASVIATSCVCAIAALSSSVRVAQSWQIQRSAPGAVTAAGRPTPQLEELLRRDQALQTQLAQAEQWSGEHRDDREFVAWKSELEQELRHVRAEAAWTEQQLGSVTP